MGTTGKVKARWTRSFFTNLNAQGDEERYSCDICLKVFEGPSNLTLHNHAHLIERKYRCDACQVSFHSLGHLQKHKRSGAHESRSQMTQVFGLPTSDNPRPYGCSECDTAFRKHGHLAKHLRSKSHITRLESRGLIPTGSYAALEKSGQDLKEKLVTTNYEQSLVSMREISTQLIQNQLIRNGQLAGPQPQPKPSQPPQPAPAPSLEPSNERGLVAASGVDNPSNMIMAHFAPAPAQQRPILSPGYFSSSSSSPPASSSAYGVAVGQPAAGLPAASILLNHQQPHLSMSPMQERALFQQLHQLPLDYPNDLPGAQMMITRLIPQHQQHSLDYTMRRNQYPH